MTSMHNPVLGDSDEWTVVETPVGDMLLVGDEQWLHYLALPGSFEVAGMDGGRRGSPAAVAEAAAQVGAYFGGQLRTFRVPLQPSGTDFQRRVWFTLADIAFGERWSYADLAAEVGNPKACRAVGLANGRNPIPLILPCHRVVGSNGSLTGYGGGLDLKRWLLDHEAAVVATGAVPVPAPA